MATGIGGIPKYSPELVDPSNRGPEIQLASAVMLSLSTVAVGLRVVSRRMIHVPLRASDYVLLLALILTIGFSILVIVATKYGLGAHVLTLTPAKGTFLLQLLFTEDMVYSVTLTTIKLSILLLYRSIFPSPSSLILRIATWSTVTLCIMWGIAALIVSIFSCTPISAYWDIWATHPHCVDQQKWYLGCGIASTLLDAMILALPVSSVWRLSLTWQQKISVSAIFLTGGFVFVASIVRLVYLLEMKPPDSSWDYYGVAMWSMIELNMSVISACLPTMRPLLVALMPCLTGLRQSIRDSFMHMATAAGSDGTYEDIDDDDLHHKSDREYTDKGLQNDAEHRQVAVLQQYVERGRKPLSAGYVVGRGHGHSKSSSGGSGSSKSKAQEYHNKTMKKNINNDNEDEYEKTSAIISSAMFDKQPAHVQARLQAAQRFMRSLNQHHFPRNHQYGSGSGRRGNDSGIGNGDGDVEDGGDGGFFSWPSKDRSKDDLNNTTPERMHRATARDQYELNVTVKKQQERQQHDIPDPPVSPLRPPPPLSLRSGGGILVTRQFGSSSSSSGTNTTNTTNTTRSQDSDTLPWDWDSTMMRTSSAKRTTTTTTTTATTAISNTKRTATTTLNKNKPDKPGHQWPLP